ncbi:MAG: (deoxy)nucleoside triphosphate pyrophosphohydrolase [Pirellulaceae bacterium]
MPESENNTNDKVPKNRAPTTMTEIAVCLIRHDNHFLVGTRPAGSKLAGYAEFPGGKVETDETPADAAVREALEETGLRVQIVRLLCQQRHEYDFGALYLHFFLCEVATCPSLSNELNPQLPTVAGSFRWVRRSELDVLQFPDANANVLSMLRQHSDEAQS